MNSTYRPLPNEPLSKYRTSGRLSFAAYDALALSMSTGKPCELVIIGEWIRDDGRRWFDYGVTTAYIDATTDYRYDRDARRLRLVCPECAQKDGKHTRTCDLR